MAKTTLLGKDKENKEKQSKAKAKSKKPRKSIGQFFKEIISELKKVTWPTFKNLLVYTGAVIAFIAIMAVITGIYDFGLAALLELLVK